MYKVTQIHLSALWVISTQNALTGFPADLPLLRGNMQWTFASQTTLYRLTVTEPTYGLHTSHPSTLDLILLNKPHLLDHCFVLPPVADHCSTLANLRLTGQRHCQPVSYSTWNYENMDSTGLHDALSSIDWSPVLNCECVDTATERWSSLFLSTVSDYVPKVLHTSRSKGKPWYSAPPRSRLRLSVPEVETPAEQFQS